MSVDVTFFDPFTNTACMLNPLWATISNGNRTTNCGELVVRHWLLKSLVL